MKTIILIAIQLLMSVLLFSQDYSNYLIIQREGDRLNDEIVKHDCFIYKEDGKIMFEYPNGRIEYKIRFKLGRTTYLSDGYQMTKSRFSNSFFLTNKKRKLYYYYNIQKLTNRELNRKIKHIRGSSI